MEQLVTISIPYRRQCFNPQVQTYLQSIERALNASMEEYRPRIASAMHDMAVSGTGTFTVGE